MWLKLFILLKVSTFFPLINAINYLIPKDAEMIYNWKAEVRAGSYLPASFVSQFVLSGEIHLQKYNNNSIIAKISNLSQRTYNGVVNHVRENEAVFVSLSEEVKELENIFEISYTDDGLVDSIALRIDEDEFSKNMKRAISGILQMDASIIDREFPRPKTLIFEENSIYGFGKVDYTIYPRNNSLEVLKTQDLSEPFYSYTNLITNREFEYCNSKPEDLVMQETRRKYLIFKDNDQSVIRNISTSGTVVYYPFKAKSDAQYIEINQNFQLKEILSIEKQYRIRAEFASTNLTYNSFIQSQNGRRRNNYNYLASTLKETLEAISRFLEENQINTQEFDSRNSQLINKAQRLLLEFNNCEELENLRKSLEPEILKIFYQILSLSETDSSKLLIKNLIINKTVDDDIAINLLQNMIDISQPSLNLLEKLEDLIHLNESYSWEVRKVAILNFGTLIYKSYVSMKRLSTQKEDDEELYNKYISEYFTKLRNSDDYKTQQVYILALRNTKLPKLFKILSPAFNGEWWQDRHLRYLSLWAATSSINANSNCDAVFEILWPIFSNCEETTELRILAFLALMQTRPSESRLRMISSFMLSEENTEVYHFYYTYLQSFAQRKEICLEDLRAKLTRVLKFTPPAKYGQSSVNFFGYRDINYDFGTSYENYFIKTNSSRIYNTVLKTQQFSRYQEEYSFYLKIRNREEKQLSLTNSIVDAFLYIFQNDFPRFLFDEKNFLEGAVLKRGQVINSYFFSTRNLFELYSFLKRFGKESSTNFEMLYINYLQYHKATIPTDLGIPVSWEFLMPTVFKKNLKIIINRNITSDIVVSNNFSSSIHYRHGLSFYNPVSHNWQGIHRYQYFDINLPIKMRISYNPFPVAVTIAWERPNDSFGLRSYVKQMIFTRNLKFEEENQIVDIGKKFRHDYTICEEEDSFTGLKLKIQAYDSSIRISSGTFKNKLKLFALPYSKQFDSLYQYVISITGNLLRYFILLPASGVYGFVVKVEPSRKHLVSQNEFFFTYATLYDTSIAYLPGINLDLQMAYAVKNQTETLKKWSASANISLEAGHDSVMGKIELNKVAPSDENLKMCIEFDGKKFQGKIFKNLNLSLGGDGHEGSSASAIEITGVDQLSSDQLDGNHRYRSCQYVVPYSWPNFYTMDCLVDKTTVREYNYEIKTRQLSNPFNKKINSWLKLFETYYKSYQDGIIKDNGDNRTRINVKFPLESLTEEVDVEISTSEKSSRFSGIPTTFLKYFGIYPRSTAYPTLFLLSQKFGMNDQWVIYSDRYIFNGQKFLKNVEKNWTLYVKGLSEAETKVYVKNIGEKNLAFKIDDYSNQTLEVVPEKSIYRISTENEVLSPLKNYQTDRLYYNVIENNDQETILVVLPKSGFHLEYYGDRLEITVSDV